MWKELVIKDFRGETPSNRAQRENECNECLNFDLREKTGDLISRKGFAEYFASSNIIENDDYRGKLTDIEYLACSNIFISDDTGGQDVTILITKGDINDSGVAGLTKKAAIQVWASHRWNGSAWARKNWDGSTAGWHWLNHTILCSVTDIDSDTWKVTTDLAEESALRGQLPGWVIYNATTNSYAAIVKAANNSGNIQLFLDRNTPLWAKDNVLYLMFNYFPYDQFTTLGTDVEAGDIVFHRTPNQLRIGFGGYADRLGLAIGFTDSYASINKLNVDATYTSNEKETFAHYIGIYCEPFTPTDNNGYALGFTPATADVLLQAGKYFVKLIGIFDAYQRVQLAHSSLALENGGAYQIDINADYARLLKRVSTCEIYISRADDYTTTVETEPYYYFATVELRNNAFIGQFLVQDTGFTSWTELIEYHQDTNAAAVSPYEANSLGKTKAGDENQCIGGSSPASVITATTPGSGTSTYNIKIDASAATTELKLHWLFAKDTGGQEFDAGYWTGSIDIYSNTAYTDDQITTSFGLHQYDLKANQWQTIKFAATNFTGKFFFSFKRWMTVGDIIHLDNLRMYRYQGTTSLAFNGQTWSDAKNNAIEMTDRCGYVPTYAMMTGWDDATASRGRMLFVNPYVGGERLINKILFTPFSGAGTPLPDIGTAENYYDTENHDGDELLSISGLQNSNIVILKQNSMQLMDPATGATRIVRSGAGVVARRSVVNFGDKIIWCGAEDIYITDGINVSPITEGTIRDEYRAISQANKEAIIATKETRDNAYTFYNAGTGEEHILTSRGWQRVSYNFGVPLGYFVDGDGHVIRLADDDGTVGLYISENDLTEAAAMDIDLKWESIEFDISVLMPQTPINTMMYVYGFYVRATVTNPITLTFTITVDGTAKSGVAISFTAGEKIVRKQFPVGYKGKRMKLAVTGADANGNSIQIGAIGLIWKPIPGGRA